jgi:thymidine kinase
MATAEFVTKVHAICTRTGGLAQYSYRKAEDNNLVLLGETNEYEPLSRQAYFKVHETKLNEITVNDPEQIISNNDV